MIVLKTKFDQKAQKFVSTVKAAGLLPEAKANQKLRIFGSLSVPMLQLGQLGVNVIKERTARGVGSDDAPMKPLKVALRRRWSKSRNEWVEYGANTGYKYRKVKEGGKPIRDLRLTGSMMQDLSLRSVSETQARIDITTQKSRMKARVNELKSPWWGWSARDLVQLTRMAAQYFKSAVADIGVRISGGGSKPVWMAPWQTIAPRSADAAWARGLAARIGSGASLNRK